jgi:hypothetical protein
LSAGAFSDPRVIEASQSFTCIFIECDWGKANTDLTKKYDVGSYPTVLYCNPVGGVMGHLTSPDPAAVAKQMLDVAAKKERMPEEAPAPLTIRAHSVSDALMAGRRFGRRVILFFRDDSPATLSIGTALNDPALKEILEGFVLGSDLYTKGAGNSAKYEITRAPTLLVLDPTLPKPEEKPLTRIEGSRSARELIRELEPLLVRAPKSDPAAPAADARPVPKEPEEKLSDDEIERRFIAARVSVAQSLLKQGKKDKAIEVYEDIIKSYPKHVDTVTVKKLLEDARK